MLHWQDIETMFETGEFLREQRHLEYKKAENAVPKDFWCTYSAFANSNGGFVVLGVAEKGRDFVVSGIDKKNEQKIIDDLLSQSRSEKVNVALISDDDIRCFIVQGKTVLAIYIRQADSIDKPIFLNGDLRNAYIRKNTGDHRLTENEHRLFLSSFSNKGKDQQILPNTGLEHINLATLNKYRNRMKAYNADQALLEKDDLDLLEEISAYQRHISTGVAGLTKAGLLMFGKRHYIRQIFSHYFLDYYEVGEGKRYDFRVNVDDLDGGNLYEFYYAVSEKLTEFAKNKHFNLNGFTLTKENEITDTLREALANTLLHADYFNDSVSVRIIKSNEKIIFENPGVMLVPIEAAVQGNSGSVCRNDFLHNMGRRIGWCDRQGKGVRDIFVAWQKDYLSTPVLNSEIDRTCLELTFQDSDISTASHRLAENLGDVFTKLTLKQQACLVEIAIASEPLSHSALQEAVLDCNARDISLMLQHLKRKNLISSIGESPRKQRYFATKPVLEALGMALDEQTNRKLTGLDDKLTGLDDKLTGLDDKLTGLDDKLTGLDDVLTPQKIDLNLNEDNVLDEIWKLPSRVNRRRLQQSLLRLCAIRPHSISQISSLFERKEKTLRDEYINDLIKQGYLDYRFPNTITHPQQAYFTTELGKQWLLEQEQNND